MHEAAINRKAQEYSRYGSAVHKQVYLYGHLDTRPTEVHRTFGMAWGMGGWLLFPFLQKIGPEATQALRARGGRAEDHVCQPLRTHGVPGGRAQCRGDSLLRPAQYRGQGVD